MESIINKKKGIILMVLDTVLLYENLVNTSYVIQVSYWYNI